MPGKRITDHQVNKYKELRGKLSQEAAAAKAGISVGSARRIETAVTLPSQRPPRHWRTRADPLAEVWDTEVVPLLEGDAALKAVTLLEELQRRHPERFGDAMLRTLQRRVRQWRAVHGAEREVFFAQEHPPGRLGLSDFTVADELGVSLGGLAFPHRLYQFALAHSGWRHARSCSGGESFECAVHRAAGRAVAPAACPRSTAPTACRRRSTTWPSEEELTARYAALCEHYGMRASAQQPGVSHENGAIESRHGTLKTALEQALLLRGTRELRRPRGLRGLRREIVRGSTPAARAAWQSSAPAAGRCRRGARPTSRRSRHGSASSASSPCKGVLYSAPVAPDRPPPEGAPVQRPPRVLARRRAVLERGRAARARDRRAPSAATSTTGT